MDIKNLKFSAEEIDSLLNKIKNLDLSNIEANANHRFNYRKNGKGRKN